MTERRPPAPAAGSSPGDGPGEVCDIGTGSPATMLEQAMLISELPGPALEIEFLPRRPGEIRHRTAAIEAARAALGYGPACDLRKGLAEIWESAWNDRGNQRR